MCVNGSKWAQRRCESTLNAELRRQTILFKWFACVCMLMLPTMTYLIRHRLPPHYVTNVFPPDTPAGASTSSSIMQGQLSFFCT